jgi:hypothetical protein
MTTKRTEEEAAGYAPATVPQVDGRDPAQRAVELRREIERTREELGQTVAELAHKADLKGRLRERTESITESITQPIKAAGTQVTQGTTRVVRWQPIPLAAALSLVLALLGYLWWRRH